MRIWGEHSEYRGIKIHPVQMKNSEVFYENVTCLLYEKNKILDRRVLQMSYLDFVFALMYQDQRIYDRLKTVLSLVLQDQEFDFKYSSDGKIFLSVNELDIDGVEFDNLKTIILDDNGLKTDEILDSEMEYEMKRLEEFKQKEQGEPATLDERIIAYHCLSGIDFDRIKNYTIWQFTQALQRFAVIKNFDVYSALLAEHGESKNVQHWMSHIKEKGRYDNLAMSQEDFNKVTSLGKVEGK